MKVYIVISYDEEIKEVFSEKEPAELFAGYLGNSFSVKEMDLFQNVFKIHRYWEFSVSGRQYGCSVNIREDYSPRDKYGREEISYSGNRTTAGSGWTHISRERAKVLAERMRKTYLDDMTNPKSDRYGIINDTSPMMSACTSIDVPIPAHQIEI